MAGNSPSRLPFLSLYCIAAFVRRETLLFPLALVALAGFGELLAAVSLLAEVSLVVIYLA